MFLASYFLFADTSDSDIVVICGPSGARSRLLSWSGLNLQRTSAPDRAPRVSCPPLSDRQNMDEDVEGDRHRRGH